MKKRVTLFAVLAALLVLTVVGCGITSTNIVGEWESQKFWIPGGEDTKATLDFRGNGSGKLWFDDDKDDAKSFKWTLSSSTLTIKMEDGTTFSTDDIKDNPDKFSITLPMKELSGGIIEDWVGTDIKFYKK